MTKDKALNHALQLVSNLRTHSWTVADTQFVITAIKEALAQPEQDGKCKYCTDGCPACDARKFPEQERFLVATIGNWGRVEWADGVFPSLGDKMYSAPRTWIGLTNDELTDLFYNENLGQESAVSQAIALLKERNT